MTGTRHPPPPEDPAGSRVNPAPDATCLTAKSRCRRWPLLVISLLTLTVLALGWHEEVNLGNVVRLHDSFRSLLEAHPVLSPLVFIIVYICMTALSLPGGLVLTVAGGLMFGWLLGSIASIVGATIGATIVFLIARSAIGETLSARAAPWLAKLRSGFNEDAFSYLLFLRLVPAFPFWFVNIAPAILGVPLSTYIVTTFLGIIPGGLALSAAGAGLDSVIAAAKANYAACVSAKGAQACKLTVDAHTLLTRETMWALILLGLAALAPIALKKWRAANAKAK